jgi:hypothetical protein
VSINTQGGLVTPRRRKTGLTFLELLIAITLFALIMISGMMLLSSIIRSYYIVETHPLFQQHANGVIRLLDELGAATAQAEQRPGGRHFRWERAPASREHTLGFNIDRDIPFFVNELIPLPPLRAHLHFEHDNEQLWLVWSVDPRFTNNERRYQYSLLSPWVADLEYIYYDSNENTWEVERASDQSRTRANQRPNHIRIIFSRGGEQVVRTLYLSSMRSLL